MRYRLTAVVAILALLLTGCGTGSIASQMTARPATTTTVSPPEALRPNDGPEMAGDFLVRTMLGKTRCALTPDQVRCAVRGDHFAQAPPVPGDESRTMTAAMVDDAGTLTWEPDPGEDPYPIMSLPDDNFALLNYGQAYTAAGWTIQPTEQGTTFTNDGSGHGLSISIDNANLSTF